MVEDEPGARDCGGTSWTCRLRGWIDLEGGGRTTMNVSFGGLSFLLFFLELGTSAALGSFFSSGEVMVVDVRGGVLSDMGEHG